MLFLLVLYKIAEKSSCALQMSLHVSVTQSRSRPVAFLELFQSSTAFRYIAAYDQDSTPSPYSSCDMMKSNIYNLM